MQAVSKPRIKYEQFVSEQMTVIPENPKLADFTELSVAWIIQRYIEDIGSDKEFGETHLYGLRALQRSPLGRKRADKLEPADLIEHCRWRKKRGACPATCMHYNQKEMTWDATFTLS